MTGPNIKPWRDWDYDDIKQAQDDNRDDKNDLHRGSDDDDSDSD